MSRRLFTAIEIPPVTAELVERSVVRAAGTSLPPARWVRRGGFHCTLRFLGARSDETAERLPRLMERTVRQHPSMELGLESLGAFPLRGKARVLWLGLDTPAELSELQTELEELLCRELDEEPEARPFHPHVTVARCKRPWGRRDVESCAEHFRTLAGERFRVEHVTLFESELHPDGARYQVLAELPLHSEQDRRGAG